VCVELAAQRVHLELRAEIDRARQRLQRASRGGDGGRRWRRRDRGDGGDAALVQLAEQLAPQLRVAARAVPSEVRRRRRQQRA
jgi:hypothetical protein